MEKIELLALAERVERLAGPDREVDAAIAHATAWRWEGWEEGDICIETRDLAYVIDRSQNGHNSIWTGIPRYTASLDAAMSLVPEGWRFAGLFERNCKLPNWIWKAELWHPEADANVRGIARNADVSAIAVTAAALRARARAGGE